MREYTFVVKFGSGKWKSVGPARRDEFFWGKHRKAAAAVGGRPFDSSPIVPFALRVIRGCARYE
jgi:hypothetical protein